MFPNLCRPPCAVLLGVASIWAAQPALAEPAPPYAALLAAAQSGAPRLAAAQAEVDQARGLARQAAVRPNPTLGLEVENFAGSGPYRGSDFSETTASLAQTFELGGKRPARVAAGRARVAAAAARSTLTRADFAAELAVAYAEAEAAQARVRLAGEALAAAKTDAGIARELVAAGREAELRALQASAEREAALAQQDEADAAREAAFARLAALAGSSVTFDQVSESLLDRAAAGPAFPSAASSTPAILAAQADHEAASAQLHAEARRAAPDVTVSAGVRRFAADDATALVAGVSIPLPIFDRNRGATQAARAEVTAAEARLRQAELDAVADLRIAQAQVRSAAARVSAAQAGEQAAAEAYRLARIGYEAGRLPLLELSSARRALSAAQTRTIDARLAQVRALTETARLSGRPPFGA